MRFRFSRDLFGGGLLIVIGVAGKILISGLPFGTAFRIGPAFLPTGTSYLIAGIGVIMTLRALVSSGEGIGRFRIRPILAVLSAFTAFGLLIEPAGLVIASFTLVVIGALAEERSSIRHAIALGVCLTIIAVLLFSVFLRLQMDVWPQWN